MVLDNTPVAEKLNDYELIFILKPDLGDEKTEAVTENIQKLITNQGGVISEVQKWGKRRLAYQIKHFGEGYYVLVKCQMKPDTNKELEANLRISEDVLRHLLVKLD